MKDFMFIYRGGEMPGTPEEFQAQMQRWIAWMQDLAANGHLKERGCPLEDAGKLVSGADKTVTDGPFAESKDLIGGFSIIQAPDLATAAEISKGCPTFLVGGSVEVRPIMAM